MSELNFSQCIDTLKNELSYIEDASFSWNDVVALLVIKLSNTDSLNKRDNNKSNATQIQLTSEADSEEYRKTEDFFPSLVLNKTFKSWRIKIPARINLDNISKLAGEIALSPQGWKNDSVQIRRRLLNESKPSGGNPALQICYENDLMDLRDKLNVGDYLVFVKRKKEAIYEAIGVPGKIDLGNGKKMLLSESAENDNTVFVSAEIAELDNSLEYPQNRILFGAPGTGKSNKINKESDAFDGVVERVTFYPNYSYAQFVGGYKPIMDKNNEIKYSYVPGPFMRQWIRAKNTPDKNFLLIIEELNRANAPAVFGDMFQLLDRKNGVSEYDVATSEELCKYLLELPKSEAEADKDTKWAWLPEKRDVFSIKLPKNLYIWATMNSADQGVFPLDTAFKRRWDYEYIGINNNEEIAANCKVKYSDGKVYFWNSLRRAINDKLSKEHNVNEDKLIGPFFIAKELLDGGDNSLHAFNSKVLMYLFEDAARHCRNSFFCGDGRECKQEDLKTYSAICDAFKKHGARIFGEQTEQNATKQQTKNANDTTEQKGTEE